MSLFASNTPESRWTKGISPEDVQKYQINDKSILKKDNACLRMILTNAAPHQLLWLCQWMKMGGTLDELWIAGDCAGEVDASSLFEIFHELQLRDETREFLSRVRSIFESLWMRYSKDIARNALTTMNPKLRQALLMSKIEGPTGNARTLLYHALIVGRTELARFFLCSEHSSDKDTFMVVLNRKNHHWIKWFLDNGANPTPAVPYAVKRDDVNALKNMKVPKNTEKWFSVINSSVEAALSHHSYNALHWLFENGADPNTENMIVADNAGLRIMLKAGADPNKFPLDTFERDKWTMLLEHGARPIRSDHFVEPWVIWLKKLHECTRPEQLDLPWMQKMFQRLSNVLGPNEVTLNLINYMTSILQVEAKTMKIKDNDSKEGDDAEEVTSRVKNIDIESDEEEKYEENTATQEIQ